MCQKKMQEFEAIIIRGAGKVHVRILSSDTKEVRKKRRTSKWEKQLKTI